MLHFLIPDFSVIFLPDIIEIRQCFCELQLKASEMFF